jgi:hypothetical protein
MAVVQLVAVVLVLALVRPWSRRVPTWLLLFPVRVGTGLRFQVVVGSAIFVGLSSTASRESGTDNGGIAPWVYAVVYASFAVQGVALAIAFGCRVRARWGRMLGERTSDVLARPAAGSWLQSHLAELAEIVAVMALIVGVVCAYWAAGGSIGLSDARPHDPFAVQASRAVGAVVAAAGLLGLVAFDVLTVVLPRSASSRAQRPPGTIGSLQETQPRGTLPLGGPIPSNQTGRVCVYPAAGSAHHARSGMAVPGCTHTQPGAPTTRTHASGQHPTPTSATDAPNECFHRQKGVDGDVTRGGPPLVVCSYPMRSVQPGRHNATTMMLTSIAAPHRS